MPCAAPRRSRVRVRATSAPRTMPLPAIDDRCSTAGVERALEGGSDEALQRRAFVTRGLEVRSGEDARDVFVARLRDSRLLSPNVQAEVALGCVTGAIVRRERFVESGGDAVGSRGYGVRLGGGSETVHDGIIAAGGNEHGRQSISSFR